jgi:cell fate regulator YaaT (PSP1 superfamily)
MEKGFKIKAAPGVEYKCLAPETGNYEVGQEVIIEYDKTQDSGVIERCLNSNELPRNGGEDKKQESKSGDNFGRILRHPNLRDQGRINEKGAREHSMLRTAIRKVVEHNLSMKIIGCHYTFDRKLVIFQFSAEGRIDFRNLVRDLAGALHTRVELRQIGVRDEAAIVGGLGICGRPLCCNTVLEKFAGVNVKTAKTQHLSLNPSSVSGCCGRLKCCLKYEVDWYREAFRRLPKNNSRCKTPQGTGKVIEVNALTEKIRVALDGEGDNVVEFSAADLEF